MEERINKLKEDLIKCYDDADGMINVFTSFLEEKEIQELAWDSIMEKIDIPSKEFGRFSKVAEFMVSETIKVITDETNK